MRATCGRGSSIDPSPNEFRMRRWSLITTATKRPASRSRKLEPKPDPERRGLTAVHLERASTPTFVLGHRPDADDGQNDVVAALLLTSFNNGNFHSMLPRSRLSALHPQIAVRLPRVSDLRSSSAPDMALSQNEGFHRRLPRAGREAVAFPLQIQPAAALLPCRCASAAFRIAWPAGDS